MRLHCPFCGTLVTTLLSIPGRGPGWFAITAERFPGGGPRSFLLRLVLITAGAPGTETEVFATREHPGLCGGTVVT